MTCAGQGFDRHLFALRRLAEGCGQELQLFQDFTYQHLNHVVVSTSTLPAQSVLIGAFAPVATNGYGIGYNVSTLASCHDYHYAPLSTGVQ